MNNEKIGFAKQFNLSRNFIDARPASSNHAVGEQLRTNGGCVRFAKIRFQGYEVAEPLKKSDKIVMERVTNKDHVPAAIADSAVKKFPIEITDKITGETRKVFVKLDMREINVLVMGMQFKFTMKAGGKTALDTRSGKRVSLDYVKSELVRMLGTEKAASEFAAFIA